MTIAWIALVLIAIGIGVMWLRKPAERPAPVRRNVPRAPARDSVAPIAPLVVDRDAPCPPELASFAMVLAGDLPQVRRKVIVDVFRDIPRPSRLLDHLLSPDFVGAASSSELVDLIAADPQIAARVLATVNSARFGLRTPVGSIGQAVVHLGLQAVRSVCLQYLLIASFKPDGPQRKQALDAVWRASALASELIQQVSQRLGLPEQGALISAVVLSFLGRLATTAAVPREMLDKIPSHGFLERVQAEQQQLGLCSAEIGRLLMTEWSLPERIVADAADIDWVLVTPALAQDTERSTRLALCYLCARLGERLAGGDLAEPAAFDFAGQAGPDFFHLRARLDDAMLARLTGLLRSPELAAATRRVLQATQEPAAA